MSLVIGGWYIFPWMCLALVQGLTGGFVLDLFLFFEDWFPRSTLLPWSRSEAWLMTGSGWPPWGTMRCPVTVGRSWCGVTFHADDNYWSFFRVFSFRNVRQSLAISFEGGSVIRSDIMLPSASPRAGWGGRCKGSRVHKRLYPKML